MASGLITSQQIEEEKVQVMTDFFFLGSKITVDDDCSHEIKKTIASWQENNDQPRQCVEKQRHDCPDKGLYSQGYGLPSGHVKLWELDDKEGRVPTNSCLWTVVLEKTPESSLDSKEIKPVNLKGDQPWLFTGKTDAKVAAPVFWSSDVNRRLIGKVPDAGKDWGQKEKMVPGDETAGWLASPTQWTWA